MSYDAAAKLLLSNKVNKNAFQNFPIVTLKKLCDAFGLPVEGTGKRPKGSKKKSDYVNAIFTFVSFQSTLAGAYYSHQRHNAGGETAAQPQHTPTRDLSPMLVDGQPQEVEMEYPSNPKRNDK
jgi:hypothetical protein